MDIKRSLPHLEAVFYGKYSERDPVYRYHNHFLQGPYLRYIQQPIKPREVGRFRLVLVQGTLKGRLAGVQLGPTSDITLEYLSDSKDDMQSRYLIHLNGLDSWGVKQQWSLAFLSEAEQKTWFEALQKAKMFVSLAESSGELRKLQEVARDMKEGIIVRKRLSRFRFYPRAFVGTHASKWIMEEFGCSLSQALAIGNRMLCLGLFHHVSHEHLFSSKNLLYRFHPDIDPLVSDIVENNHRSPGAEDDSLENNILTAEFSHTINKLLTAYVRLQREVSMCKLELQNSNTKLEKLIDVYNNLQAVAYEYIQQKITTSVILLKIVFASVVVMLFLLILAKSLMSEDIRIFCCYYLRFAVKMIGIEASEYLEALLIVSSAFAAAFTTFDYSSVNYVCLLLAVVCLMVIYKVIRICYSSMKVLDGVSNDSAFSNTKYSRQLIGAGKLEAIQLRTNLYLNRTDSTATATTTNVILSDNNSSLHSLSCATTTSTPGTSLVSNITLLQQLGEEIDRYIAATDKTSDNNYYVDLLAGYESNSSHSSSTTSDSISLAELFKKGQFCQRYRSNSNISTTSSTVRSHALSIATTMNAATTTKGGLGFVNSRLSRSGSNSNGGSRVNLQHHQHDGSGNTSSPPVSSSSPHGATTTTIAASIMAQTPPRPALHVATTSSDENDSGNNVYGISSSNNSFSLNDKKPFVREEFEEEQEEDDEVDDDESGGGSEAEEEEEEEEDIEDDDVDDDEVDIDMDSEIDEEINNSNNRRSNAFMRMMTPTRNLLSGGNKINKNNSNSNGNNSSSVVISPSATAGTHSSAVGIASTGSRNNLSAASATFSSSFFHNHSNNNSQRSIPSSISIITSSPPLAAAATLSPPWPAALLESLGTPVGMSAAAAVNNWPNRPIMIRRSEKMLRNCLLSSSSGGGNDGTCSSVVNGSSDSLQQQQSQRKLYLQPLQIHIPGPPELSEIAIDSDLFVGKAFIMIANLPDPPKHIRGGRKVKFRSIIQGSFRRRVSFASIHTGQIFEAGPLTQFPARWMQRSACKMLSNVMPGLQMCLTGERPYLLAPLAATACNIAITRKGQQQPSIANCDVLENMSLLNPLFDNMSTKKRKKYFADRNNLVNYSYDPDLVYTFDITQNLLNFGTLQFDLGFMKYDVLKSLGRNPIQIMAVEWNPVSSSSSSSKEDAVPKSCSYLYNFEVWHQKQLLLPNNVSNNNVATPPHVALPAGGSSTAPTDSTVNNNNSNNVVPDELSSNGCSATTTHLSPSAIAVDASSSSSSGGGSHNSMGKKHTWSLMH